MQKLPNYVKPAFALSVFAGLVLGIVLLIPFLQVLAVFIFWFIGSAIVYILKRANFIGVFTQKEGVAIGSIAGVVSVCAASVVFLPLLFIVNFVFHLRGLFSFFAPTFFTSLYDLIVIIMLIVFLGFINAIFNVGSSLVAIYIVNTYFSEKNSEEIGEFKIDV